MDSFSPHGFPLRNASGVNNSGRGGSGGNSSNKLSNGNNGNQAVPYGGMNGGYYNTVDGRTAMSQPSATNGFSPEQVMAPMVAAPPAWGVPTATATWCPQPPMPTIGAPARSAQDSVTDRRVDWRRYMGRWSEAASLPQPFEAGCTNVSAEYAIMTPRMIATAVEAGILDPTSLVPGGVIVSVRNMCTLADGRVVSVDGFAQPVGPGRLRVTFGRDADIPPTLARQGGAADPGNYRVLEVGAGYEYALVGSGPRAAWVLVRSPDLPPDVIEQLVARLRDVYGYDVSAIRYATQAE